MGNEQTRPATARDRENRLIDEAAANAVDRIRVLERDLGPDFDPLTLEEDDAAHVALLLVMGRLKHARLELAAKSDRHLVAMTDERNKHRKEVAAQSLAHSSLLAFLRLEIVMLRALAATPWYGLPWLTAQIAASVRRIEQRTGIESDAVLGELGRKILNGTARP